MDKEYKQLIKSLKEHIRLYQQQTVLSVNTRMLFLYWEIGQFVNHQKEKLGWGTSVIQEMSKDLSTEFPEIKGFSVRNLNYMAQFAEYHSSTNMQPPVARIKNKDKDIEQTSELEKVQPLVAQIQAAIHWTDFTKLPIAKVTWSHHIVLMDKTKT